MAPENCLLDIEKVKEFLPHRAPFLMVDRILEINLSCPLTSTNWAECVGTKVKSIKNVTYNEPHMLGHFPSFSIMPGVLIVEAMAQTTVFSIYPLLRPTLKYGRMDEKFNIILTGVDGAKFRKPVVPGDTLVIETVAKKIRGSIWIFDCLATVDGKRAAEAEIMANLIPIGEKL